MTTATDISCELLLRGRQAARARGLRIRFIQVEPLRLPFRTASVSLALAFKVYCYIPSRNLRIQYLREIARVLQPGGVLAMTHYVTPAEWIAAAYDEAYRRIARDYTTLEPGDAFVVLDGDDGSIYSYVHVDHPSACLRQRAMARPRRRAVRARLRRHPGSCYQERMPGMNCISDTSLIRVGV